MAATTVGRARPVLCWGSKHHERPIPPPARHLAYPALIPRHEREAPVPHAGVSRLRKVLAFAALCLLVVACTPNPGPPPANYRSHECPHSLLIESVFDDTGDVRWAIDTAMRESRCDPCAYYPGRSDCTAMPRTARGLFQLLGHDDLLRQVCLAGSLVWYDPWCNTQAARLLYDRAGRAPWSL